MLQKETIEPGTLELLKQLQREPLLQSFNLVGGTALALRMGHRKSIDLDLFTREAFDLEEVTEMLVHHYGMTVTYARKQTLKGFINKRNPLGDKIGLVLAGLSFSRQFPL